ncbi:hypothetical protein ES702_05722 [subsurface metagenome]
MSAKRKILIGLLVLFAVVVIAGGGYALYYAGYRMGYLSSSADLEEGICGIFRFHDGFPHSRMLKRPYAYFGRGYIRGFGGFFPFKIILGILAIIGITALIVGAVIYHKKMFKQLHMKLGEHPVDKTPQSTDLKNNK